MRRWTRLQVYGAALAALALATTACEEGPGAATETGALPLAADGDAAPLAVPIEHRIDEAAVGTASGEVAATLSPAAAQLRELERETASLHLRGLKELQGVAEVLLALKDERLPPLGTPGARPAMEEAEELEPNEDGAYCWTESYPEGWTSEGCWHPETGAFRVEYVFAEPYEGVQRLVQEGVSLYTSFDAGWSEFEETSYLVDGDTYLTTWSCAWEANETECSAETESGDLGWVHHVRESDYVYEEQIWTDAAHTYDVAWGTTYVVDGSLQYWYWWDDPATPPETDYLTQMFYDPDLSGWGMFEVPDATGELVRYSVIQRADGGGFYMDADGDVAPFAPE